MPRCPCLCVQRCPCLCVGSALGDPLVKISFAEYQLSPESSERHLHEDANQRLHSLKFLLRVLFSRSSIHRFLDTDDVVLIFLCIVLQETTVMLALLLSRYSLELVQEVCIPNRSLQELRPGHNKPVGHNKPGGLIICVKFADKDFLQFCHFPQMIIAFTEFKFIFKHARIRALIRTEIQVLFRCTCLVSTRLDLVSTIPYYN